MIHFIKFGYRGVGSFGNQWVEIPFGMGLTQISGENGSGKSTLLECVFYSLYGEPFQRETIGELVSWQNGKQSFETGIWFSRASVVYKVMRTLSSETLTRINDDGSETPVEGFQGKAGFQKEIDRLLGLDSDTARRVLFISADDTKPFPELKASDKRQFIEDYFRLGIVAKMEAIVKQRKTKASSNVDIALKTLANSETHVKYLESNVENENVRFNQAIERGRNSLAELDRLIVSTKFGHENVVTEKTARVTALEDKLKEANVKKDEFIAMKEELALESENEADELERTLATVIDGANATNEQVNTELDRLTKDHQSALEAKKVANAEELDALAKTHESDKASLDEFTKKIADCEERIRKLTVEIAGERAMGGGLARIGAIDARLGQIKTEAMQLMEKRNFLKDSLVCPECNSDITEEHRASEIKKLADEFNALKEENETITEERELVVAHQTKAKTLEADLTTENLSLRGFTTQHATFKSAVDGYPRVVLQTKKNHESVLDSMASTYSRRAIELKSKLVDVNELREVQNGNIESLRNKASSIRATALNTFGGIVSNIENTLAVARGSLEDVTLANDKEMTDLVGRRTKANEDLSQISRDALDKATFDLTKAREAYSQMETELASKQAELKRIEEMCFILGDKGVKPFFINSFVPVLNHKVADLLKCFSLPVHIEFDDQLNMKMLNLRSPKEVKYRQHSKGERRRITTAILLAFIEIVSEKMGWHCDQMFFDEFLDDGMDAKGMEDLIEIIQSYSERKDTGIVVVSHKAKSENFDRNWYVTKNEDGFSNVAIKE